MGRTYSFHPFSAQQPAVGVQGSAQRLGNGNDEDKTKLTKQAEDPPNAPKPYREPNAETVRRYKQKAAARKKKTEKSARSEKPTSKSAAKPKQQRRAATVASPSLAARPNAPAAERPGRKPLRKRVAAKAAKVTSVVAGAGMLAASALMKRRANKRAAKATRKQQK